jgi:acylphosphatase
VEEFARQLKLTGFVENIKPYDVRIVGEGEDEALEQFIEKVQITKPPIRVEHVEAQFEPATGEFEYFAIKRGDMPEELGEWLDVFNAILAETVRRHDS